MSKTYAGSITTNGNRSKFTGRSGASGITSYESFNTAVNYDIWFPAASDKVTIHLTGSDIHNKIKFDIMFDS